MKKMTKVFSLLLAVAMILSLVTVNVAAAGDIAVKLEASSTSVMAGNEFEVSFNITSNPGFNNLKLKYTYDKTKLELVTPKAQQDKGLYPGWMGNGTSTLAWLNGDAESDFTDTGVAAVLKFKVKSDAALGNTEISATCDEDYTGNVANAMLTCDITNVTVSITEETNITSITAGTAEVPYGADEAAVKAALPTTLKGSGQTTGGSPVTDMALEVASWDVSAVNTNPETAATQVAKATLKDAAGINVSDAAKAQAVANVTLTALTTGDFEAEAEMKVPVKAENAAYTTNELKALVVEKYAKVTVKNGAIEAEYVPDVTVTGTAANVGDIATATLSVSGESANKKFNITTPVTKNVTITLIPAEVTDGSASWKASTVISSNTNIEVAVDYAAEYAGKKLVVSVVTDAEGATPVTKEFDLPALPEDAAEGAKGSYTAALGKLKAIFGTAPAAGTILTFGVKVDGAAVAYEVAEDGTATMEQTVKVVNSSGGSSASGLPSGNGSNSNKKTYTIVVEESENGTATAPEKAAKGDKVTVTTTPAEGYKTDVITVKTGKGINVPVTDKSFTMPDANVTITVTFVEGEEPTPVDPSTPSSDLFSDVPSTHWAYSFIKEMKDLGIVNGVSNTEFAPDANITRAEFAKMVAQAFGLKATATESVFTDCTASDWYTPFVIAGTEAGILKGISDTEFGANQQITRQDICTVLGRILDAENTISAAADSSFTDIDQVADYAVAAVKAFVAAGVVNGYEDGTFRPTANATRAEVSKILCSVLKLDNAVSKAAYAALTGAEVEAEPAADAEDKTDAEDVNADADAEAEADADAEADAAADADANAEDTTNTDAEDTTVDDGSAPEK